MQTSKLSLSQFLIESEKQARQRAGDFSSDVKKICWLLSSKPQTENKTPKSSKVSYK